MCLHNRQSDAHRESFASAHVYVYLIVSDGESVESIIANTLCGKHISKSIIIQPMVMFISSIFTEILSCFFTIDSYLPSCELFVGINTCQLLRAHSCGCLLGILKKDMFAKNNEIGKSQSQMQLR